jgi:hypothetical protein
MAEAPAPPRTVVVEFDPFGWELLTAEAERQGVSVEAVVRHATMYLIADRDSGRVAQHVLEVEEPKGRFRRGEGGSPKK